MRIDFYLRYHTKLGQSLWMTGNTDGLGNNDTGKALQMNYLNDQLWHLSLEVTNEKHNLAYRYIFQNESGENTLEGEKHRSLKLEKTPFHHITVIDTWTSSRDVANAFYTAPFTNVLLKETKTFKVKKFHYYTHTFKIKAPLLHEDECVCLLGSDDALHKWDQKKPLLLIKENEWWAAHIDLSSSFLPLTYKYGVYNLAKQEFVRYETGENRLLHLTGPHNSETVMHDGFIRLPKNTWKGAGVALPVFSLRTENSFGIGEFTDLKLLADWAAQSGMKLIQILPVNDTTATHTWKDSYPYAAISAFALNPVYMNLEKTAGKEYASIVNHFSKKKKELNALPQVDYEKVLHTKLNILRELYQANEGDFLEHSDYKKFFDSNAYWLIPYAAFSYFRDKYGTPEFLKWESHAVYNEAEIKALCSPRSKQFKEIAFWYYVQYNLHLQLKEAAEYAHSKGVVVKGDIPIGIYRNGCDAWMAPELYYMDLQAGAPPDDFSVKGQNWGFPTYNWQKMQENHFEWWHRRFHQMSNYFDTFRIDHILGFFRIWSVPLHAVEGILGIFVPAVTLKVYEFENNGIRFNYERFCKPFINDLVVRQVFGGDADMVMNTYLQWNYSRNLFDMKEEFNTQRKVEQHFASLPNDDWHKRIKLGLFDLISNVILIEEPGSNGEQFHFRISMEKTSSYQQLDDHLKHPLYQLYVHFFYYRHDECWRREAMKKLPALKESTSMLICGEDLGMVPHCVPEVMQMLGILSLEIQRMPKDPKTEFFHPNNAPYLSVITPSTHDMSTVRGWWEEDRPRTQVFFNTILGQQGAAPYFCDPWINKAIVLQHLYAPAMWSIFQLQDWLGISKTLRRDNPHEERINQPADPNHYWRYRMHMTLEQLLKEKEFSEEIKDYITKSGR